MLFVKTVSNLTLTGIKGPPPLPHMFVLPVVITETLQKYRKGPSTAYSPDRFLTDIVFSPLNKEVCMINAVRRNTS